MRVEHGTYSKEYNLFRGERKSIKLTVYPDETISVIAPNDAPIEHIEDFLRRKWRWIDKQVLFFRKFKKSREKREYISGESFYYLGRQYQLVVRKSKEDNVALSHGKIHISSTQGSANPNYTRKLLDMWYKERAKEVFEERFSDILPKFKYKKKVRFKMVKLSKKWGTYREGVVSLNPKLIQAPKSAIDYVIVHELCHVRYKNHDKRFWRFEGEMFPDWKKTKEQLEVRFG